MRRGFTLIEMLVAVALVVLMMSIFASIFQFSTQTMAVQKGTAENDQHVRLVMTVLRGDLTKRTFGDVSPFFTGETVGAADPRQGYLYIGENDPDDDTDDVLQLTVKSPNDPFFGRAYLLTGNIGTDPNQPEFDDGIVSANGAGSSEQAEVSWFLRHGTLYRRVLLIRQPIKPTITTDGTPMSGPSGNVAAIPITLYEGTAPTATARNFATDMDYSAYYDGTKAQFHHYTASLTNGTGGASYALGLSNYRFGFDPVSGQPREFSTQYLNSAGATVVQPRFIGRFTHEETSYIQGGSNPTVSFGYPARATGASPNPYTATLTYDESTGKVREFTTGGQNDRTGEDILMTNVHRFDVKVFDDAAGLGPDSQPGVAGVDDDGLNGIDDAGEIGWPGSDDGDFKDVGHSGFRFLAVPPDRSFYGASKVANATYSPAGKYRFDTWHPNAVGQPPFRAPDTPLGKRPLRALQIRITFFDQTSQQLRDVTLVQSLQ